MDRPPLLFALVLALLVSCATASPDRKYVLDERTDSFIALPNDWRVFERSELDAGQSTDPYATEGDPVLYKVGFAADARVPAAAVLAEDSPTPTGLVMVLQLNEQEQQTVSMLALRNQFIDVDKLRQQDPASVVVFVQEPLLVEGYRGEHMVFSVRSALDAAHPYGRSFTVDQSFLLDPSGQNAYFLLVTCSSDCYGEHELEIREVVRSWSVVEA